MVVAPSFDFPVKPTPSMVLKLNQTHTPICDFFRVPDSLGIFHLLNLFPLLVLEGKLPSILDFISYFPLLVLQGI